MFAMFTKLLKSYYWIWLAIASFLFAWNSQSFWIDECCMAMCALPDTFVDVWAQATNINGSDTQMACYLFLLHIWIKLSGADSEMMLRLFNIVWVLLAAYFLRRDSKVLILLIISPFFLYYANELRPYIMQIAASCGVSMFLYEWSLGKKKSYALGFGLLFLLCTTSLTSVVWAAGFLMAWITLEGRDFWSKKLVKAFAYWGVAFVGLGCYYLYTLIIGARATYIPSSAFVNLGASAYELLGLTGLGPARSELRLYTQLGDNLELCALLLPILCGIVVTTILVCGLYAWRKQTSNVVLVSIVALFIFPLAVFVYGSEVMNFRFSGRHFAPILPLICIVISMGLKWCRHKPYQTVLSSIFVLAWLASDVYIRFDATYAREDYKGAIEYCQNRKARGENVLLLCNPEGKKYYGWQDDILPENWKNCQSIVVSRPIDFKETIELIEYSGIYQKRKLCPSFWVYEPKL